MAPLDLGVFYSRVHESKIFFDLEIYYEKDEGVAIDEGNNLFPIQTSSLSDCERECSATPECNSFSGIDFGGSAVCWLKDKCVGKEDLARDGGGWKTYYKICLIPTNEPSKLSFEFTSGLRYISRL